MHKADVVRWIRLSFCSEVIQTRASFSSAEVLECNCCELFVHGCFSRRYAGALALGGASVGHVPLLWPHGGTKER